ncbi:CoA transferase subunit A [Bacillus infantis]|uniref:CoA transferase subunit A n=1 Tax=Bacillus infantis TaxID=324767 RepID=UPI00209E813A|nr:CoA transferase subunit A [Bacillus infantis]MCP1159205.1 CoA transferase subunit A [Bacillus infantis]MCR6611625.1 CoA transferase subunit A [Bacillus infantis]
MSSSFSKIVTAAQAMNHFHDGISIIAGGFGGIGTPPALIEELIQKGTKNITLICNDAGFPHIGAGRLVTLGRVRKLIASHIGSNPEAGRLMNEGKLEVEFSPQGTLAERIRAGGVGIAGILTDIGISNEMVSAGKATHKISGKEYLIETAITADISIVYAKKADPFGNLIYDKSARNTNPLAAMAGNKTIAEVEEIVPLGAIDPDEVMTPGVFVDYVVPSKGVNWKWAWE